MQQRDHLLAHAAITVSLLPHYLLYCSEERKVTRYVACKKHLVTFTVACENVLENLT